MKFYLLLLLYILSSLGFYLMQQDFIWYVLSSLLFFGIVVWGVSVMRLNLFLKSQSSIDASKNEIALTFDDGPDPELTSQVLDVLKAYNAKATFFVIGSKIEANRELIQRIIQEGHGIGNHTYEHSNMFPIWSVRKMKVSIRKTDDLLNAISGGSCQMFRPPFGVTNNLIALAVQSLGKKTIGWNIRTKDSCKSAEQVIAKVKKELTPGVIVLFHDTNPHIIEELRVVLMLCEERALKSIALS